jgi:CubicO group peptidase (beta-lactamase class C family)
MEKLQFQVLYRQFLFRMVDLELLSAHAQGDTNKLFGQFASLLIFISIGLAVPTLAFGGRMPPAVLLNFAWSCEHFLIATTMLVVGLFAVLSWDSTYPDRRDVMVLAPLPVRPRTLFCAKVAGVATALGFTVVILHCGAGLVWPLALNTSMPTQSVPALSSDPALPPLGAASIQAVLDRDLAPAMLPGGPLAPATGAGVAIGVWKHGVRRVFAYGTARPDSLFQIGSITKTFTGLALMRMVAEGKVRLDEPVRELLPPGTVPKPAGREITLLDLATHQSGLLFMPTNLNEDGKPNPGADYHTAELYEYLAQRGLAKNPNTSFQYSNLGFGLLGAALAERAGLSYADLLQREVTGPLGLHDTVLAPSAAQEARTIQAYDAQQRPMPPWELDALAGAGAIRSTAGDMLTYLEANLHPEAVVAASPALSEALAQSHELKADGTPGRRVAIAWFYNSATGVYSHDGFISGYTSLAFFHPRDDDAAVVLVNQGPGPVALSALLGEHIHQRMDGTPAVALGPVTIPATGSFLGLLRLFAVYWITMIAAGGFIFGCVLGVQGVAAQVLPRRLFLRANSFLQMAALCLFLSVYFLQPMFADPGALVRAQGTGPLAWSPSYWFLGLFQQLNGSPAFAILARRAWTGLAVVAFATTAAYALSYLRTLRKIVEEPDIVPGTRTAGWLPRFGGPRQTAVAQFTVRTLLRSRQHRVLLAFYLGIGFAIMIFLLSAPATRDVMAVVADPWREVNLPMLSSSIVMMCAWIMGTRVVFSMPIDLRANWIFRITPVRGGPEFTAARRRALLAAAVAPLWLGSAALFLALWPWRPAAGHLLVLGLLGGILVELSLAGVQKIPFTCSYLPGKSQVHMRFWFCLAVLLQMLNRASELVRGALQNFITYAILAGLLALVLVCLRWRTANSMPEELEFEDKDEPAVQELGLHRDGVLPIEPSGA